MSTSIRRRLPGRKKDILVVFTQKVAEQGYDATSISDIAAELDVSKGTVMHHYGSKDRMLEQMSMGYMDRRLRELAVIRRTFADPQMQLAALVTSLMTAFRDDYFATRAFSREFMRFADSEVMAKVREQREDYTDQVRAIIEEGVATDRLACDIPKITTLQIIGMCNWGWTWIDPAGPIDIDDIASVFVNNILRGLTTGNQSDFSVELPQEIMSERALNRGLLPPSDIAAEAVAP